MDLSQTKPTPAPIPRPARTVTPLGMPSMRDLSRIVTNLASARTLQGAVIQLQRDIRRLLQVTDVLCVWIDWPRRAAWSVTGRVGDQVQALVTDVAVSGRREVIHNTLIEPIGLRPSRAVLALRRPSGFGFEATELAMVSTLVGGIAPALDRLIGDHARGSAR